MRFSILVAVLVWCSNASAQTALDERSDIHGTLESFSEKWNDEGKEFARILKDKTLDPHEVDIFTEKRLHRSPESYTGLALKALFCFIHEKYEQALDILDKMNTTPSTPDEAKWEPALEHQLRVWCYLSLKKYEDAVHEARWLAEHSSEPADHWMVGIVFLASLFDSLATIPDSQLAMEGLACLKKCQLHEDFDTLSIRQQQDCRLVIFGLMEAYLSCIYDEEDPIKPDYTLMELYGRPIPGGASEKDASLSDIPDSDDDFVLCISGKALDDYEQLYDQLVDETSGAFFIEATEKVYVKIILLRQKILMKRQDNVQIAADIVRMEEHVRNVGKQREMRYEKARQNQINQPAPEWSFGN
jgi:hypothetical protein